MLLSAAGRRGEATPQTVRSVGRLQLDRTACMSAVLEGCSSLPHCLPPLLTLRLMWLFLPLGGANVSRSPERSRR